MTKSTRLSSLLKNRIINGDYALKILPAERQLAKENNVSHMTARRAVQILVDDGILIRNDTGRLVINRNRDSESRTLKFAFLLPDFDTPAGNPYRRALDLASDQFGKVRPVYYLHWDDPLITDALEGFDGLFLLPSSEPIPPAVMMRFAKSNHPVIAVSQDLTEYGIPSIYLMPPIFVQKLLDHLEERGCRRIGCLNVQPHDVIVERRIEQWKIWMAAHKFEGPLLDEPVEPYGETLSKAYDYTRRLIDGDKLNVDALLCITASAAVASVRAMHDAGVRPGVDISVCTVAGEYISAYTVPSITTLEDPDPAPYMLKCLNYMASGDEWVGPLLMQPAEVQLLVRESTAWRRL